MNDVFYKYRADSEYTEAIFMTGQVYLSTAAGLNDPFECSLQDIAKDWMKEKIETMQRAAVAGLLIAAGRSLRARKGFLGLSVGETRTAIKRLGRFKRIEEAYEYYYELIKKTTGHAPSDCRRTFTALEQQLDSVGIFSLSALSDHPLMWAHYASEHRGICLGFKRLPGCRMADGEHFFRVVYSDTLPEIDPEGPTMEMKFGFDENGKIYTSGYGFSFADKTIQRVITTKSTIWKYEEEWRYVEPNGGSYNWPGNIVELTFGLKCPDTRRRHYINLAEAHIPNSVRLFEMRKKPGTSGLERVPFEVPFTSPRLAAAPPPTPSTVDVTTTLDGREFFCKMERFLREGNYAEVIFQTDGNLKDHPDSLPLLSLKGTAHGYAGQPEKALECFTKVTKAHPTFGQGWYQLSCALVQLKQVEKALEALRQASVLEPNDPSVALNLGVLLSTQADTREEALRVLRRADQLGHRRARRLIADLEALISQQPAAELEQG